MVMRDRLPNCLHRVFARRADGCFAGRVDATQEPHVGRAEKGGLSGKKERTPVIKAETE